MIDDTKYPLIVFKELEPAVSKIPNGLEDQTEIDRTERTHVPDGAEDEPGPSTSIIRYPTPPKELLLNRWDPQTTWRPNVELVRKTPDRAMLRSPEGLMRQLQEIQKHQVNRDRIISWADNLKLLTGGPTSAPSSTEPDPARSFFKCSCRWADRPVVAGIPVPCSCASVARPFDTSSKHFSLVRVPRCPHYVAISYRWRKSTPDEEIIISDGGQMRSASAPPSILLRAAAFAQHHGYRLLWCDQEGIDQNNREDKEPAIQAMDIVYERAAVCLAPLDIEIDTQAQLDALATATEPSPFPKWDDWIEWVENMPWKTILAIAEVAQTISSDTWFSRSWIFQESTAAYATMLLIKCKKDLDVPEHLGNLSGEIELPMCAFRLVVCKLQKTFSDWIRREMWNAQRVAEMQSYHHMRPAPPVTVNYAEIETCEKWIQVLGEFVMHTLAQVVHGKRYLCSALEACQRLAKRRNGTVSDRLAIMSNLCGFSIRLDSSKLAKLGYDLAACFLCLSILNGDLSVVRVEDGVRYGAWGLSDEERILVGISKGMAVDESMMDFQVGPPLFRWAPRLTEGLTESRLARKPGHGKHMPFKYHFSFRGPSNLLHIEGWLWEYWRRVEIPHLAKRFYRRRFDENGWANRFNKSELPTSTCNLEDCCKMTDPSIVRQCFWDLIQFWLQEGAQELAESLWVSLLISENDREVEGNASQLDPRSSVELRRKVHTISMEEFSNQITLDNVSEDRAAPQFWIIQKAIHTGRLDIWRLSSRTADEAANQKLSCAFFNCADNIPVFTPYRTSRETLTPQKALNLQQYNLSWPVKTEPLPNDSSQVAVSIHPTDVTTNPIRGFWNVDNIPPIPYVLH